MGSMFEEMKKVKKHLRDTRPKQQQVKASGKPSRDLRTEPVTCPACGQQVALDALKNHLVETHKVDKRATLDEALTRLSAGRVTAAQLCKNIVARGAGASARSGKPSIHQQKSAPASMPRQADAKPKKSYSVEPRHKDLSQHSKQVLRLSTGETHVVYVKRTGSATLRTAPLSRPAPPPPRANIGNTRIAAQPRAQAKPSLSPIHKVGVPNMAFKLGRPDEFKQPDEWVQLGRSAALPALGKAVAIYMGIDFGTAYTKASIGFGGDIFIIDWRGVKAGSESLTFPGEFSVLQDGACLLGQSPGATRIASNLKLPFLERHVSEAKLVDATVFLALIMRYVRAWWFHHHAGLMRGRSLDWNVNLGAPTTPWEDQEICTKYKRAAKAAWLLSLESSTITCELAKRVLDELIHVQNAGLPPVEIVPEFVAQIASYTRSPQRQPDLHLLIDVGAGTVDIVTFNVHRDDHTEEDCFPIFWGAVRNLGTHYLMSRRFELCSANQAEAWNDASSVPTTATFSQISGVALSTVQRVDQTHAMDVASSIASVLYATRHRRYRRSPSWGRGVRVFLCGGGSSCPTIEQALPFAAKQFGSPLSRIRLPLPERLKAPDLPTEQFHRLSVAFGLGIDVLNLGQIVTRAEVEDDLVAPLPMRAHFNWNDG